MAIRTLEYSDRQDILDLFDSINYQIYDGYSNQLNISLITSRVNDEEWFNSSSIYGNYVNNTLDCFSVARNNEALPFRVHQWFYRYNIDNREMTEGFDSNLLSLLNESFRQETEAGHNFHMTIEATSINGQSKKRYFEITSYLKEHYYCCALTVTSGNENIAALNELELDIPTYKEYFDQIKQHGSNIERTEYLYYLKNRIL